MAAVVPFISEELSKKNKVVHTFTTDIDEFERDKDLILLINIDAEQISLFNDGKPNCTYDFRVGELYQIVGDKKGSSPKYIGAGSEVIIKPRSFIVIATREEIYLPVRKFGYISSRVSNLMKGIVVAPSKVDPGYSGKLMISLFNLGQNDVTLKHGDAFCNLTVFSVADGANLYDKEAKGPPGESAKRKGFLKSASLFLKEKKTELTLLLSLGSFLTAIAMVIITYLMYHKPPVP